MIVRLKHPANFLGSRLVTQCSDLFRKMGYQKAVSLDQKDLMDLELILGYMALYFVFTLAGLVNRAPLMILSLALSGCKLSSSQQIKKLGSSILAKGNLACAIL